MDQGQLVSEEIDAGAELVRRLDQYVPVKAAFWVKDSEEKQWYLYIASDQITGTNRGAAYGQVLRLAGELAGPYFDPFLVKLIPTSDPLAQAALEIHHRYPSELVIRLGGTSFGGMGVDGVYLYPASVATLTP